MKQHLTLILIILILSSCERNNSDKSESELKTKKELKTELKSEPEKELQTIHSQIQKDTIHNYWALILDTITSKNDFKIANIKQTLEIKTYSLNDSSIVKNLSQNGERVYLDYSHKMVTELKLSSDSLIDKKQIDRTDFEKSLATDFYDECNLYSTELDSVYGNSLFLTTDLIIPDTDNKWRVWYSIKIINNEFGSIEINETEYAGM